MAEEGVNDEAAFSQDTTLFESLRERKREAIDRTLTQISINASAHGELSVRTVTSTARSYTTRGKDVRYATTEVSFQVAAPIDVEIRLEDVGLVWCPRMPSPFMALHQVINALEADARQDYLLQNQVIDPVRPPEASRPRASPARSAFAATRAISRCRSRSRFRRNPRLETRPRCDEDRFRNGTSDDYNWDEAWNWDDLQELARLDPLDITSRERHHRGGVLETTDPEMLNRGFLTFDIAMKRLTDESRVAIEA